LSTDWAGAKGVFLAADALRWTRMLQPVPAGVAAVIRCLETHVSPLYSVRVRVGLRWGTRLRTLDLRCWASSESRSQHHPLPSPWEQCTEKCIKPQTFFWRASAFTHCDKASSRLASHQQQSESSSSRWSRWRLRRRAYCTNKTHVTDRTTCRLIFMTTVPVRRPLLVSLHPRRRPCRRTCELVSRRRPPFAASPCNLPS
jgi:hypothetical protein